jgi:hypothetical protein
MKLRLLAMIVGASCALALGACSSDEDDGDATGGSGGSGGSGNTGNEGGSGNTGNEGGAGVGAAGGAGGAGTGGNPGECPLGADDCIGCGEFITEGYEACTEDDFCEGSQDLYDAYTTCICVDSCMTECADACAGGDPTAECQTCATTNCTTEIAGCGGDISDP